MSSNQEAAVLVCEFVNGDRYRKFKNSVQINTQRNVHQLFRKMKLNVYA